MRVPLGLRLILLVVGWFLLLPVDRQQSLDNSRSKLKETWSGVDLAQGCVFSSPFFKRFLF